MWGERGGGWRKKEVFEGGKKGKREKRVGVKANGERGGREEWRERKKKREGGR